MKITKVSVKDFRNIENIEINLCENANIIYGDNGQGKTNFLEALWMFTGAKSFRGVRARLCQFRIIILRGRTGPDSRTYDQRPPESQFK